MAILVLDTRALQQTFRLTTHSTHRTHPVFYSRTHYTLFRYRADFKYAMSKHFGLIAEYTRELSGTRQYHGDQSEKPQSSVVMFRLQYTF